MKKIMLSVIALVLLCSFTVAAIMPSNVYEDEDGYIVTEYNVSELPPGSILPNRIFGEEDDDGPSQSGFQSPFQTLTGIFGGSVDVSLALRRDDLFCEKMIYSDSNFGADVVMFNGTSDTKYVTPFIALYSDNRLVEIKSKAFELQADEEKRFSDTVYIPQNLSTDTFVKIFVFDNNLTPLIDPVTVTQTEQDFFGNNLNNATLIPNIGNNIVGKIDYANDVDVLKFIPKRSGSYTFLSESQINMTAHLYQNSQLIKSHTTGGSFSLTANLMTGQHYYLSVTSASVEGYTILSECDNVMPISANSTNFGYITNDIQMDWYKISESSSGLLSLSLSDIPTSSNYKLAICDTTGNVIMDGGASGANKIIDKFSILGYNEYYIIIYSAEGASKTQPYKLISSFIPVADKDLPENSFAISPPSGVAFGLASEEEEEENSQITTFQTQTIDADELREQIQNSIIPTGGGYAPAAVTGTAVTIPQNSSIAVSGRITSTGGYILYNTYINSGEKLSASLISPSGKDYMAIILDSNLEILGFWSGNKGSRSVASYKSAYSGTYHVMVVDINNSGVSAQNFNLTLYRQNSTYYDSWEMNDQFEDANAKNTAFNAQLGTFTSKVSGISNLNIDTPIDADRFPVYLYAGDKLSVNIAMGSGYNDSVHQYRIHIEWFNDAGNYLWTSLYDNPNSVTEKYATFIAQESRQYYISIYSDSYSNNRDVRYKLTPTIVRAANVNTYEKRSSIVDISNDFIDYARDITSETTFTTTLDNQLDVDFYRLYDATSAKTKTFTMSNFDVNTRMELREKRSGVYRYIPSEGGGSKIVANLEKGVEYFLMVYSANWNPSNKNYTLNITNTQNVDGLRMVTNPSYNGGASPTLGAGNTLTFGMAKNTSGNKSFWIEPAASWDEGGEIWGKSEVGKTETFNGAAAKTVTFNNITFSGGGDKLNTYIRAYNSASDRTLVFASPPYTSEVVKTITESDLRYEKVTRKQSFFTGAQVPAAFIYINNPEFISDLDVIQPEKSSHTNQLIYNKPWVEGYNTMVVSHSTNNQKDYVTQQYYFDIDFYNFSQNPVTIKFKNPYARLVNGLSGYFDLRNLCKDRLDDANGVTTFTIPAYNHKTLFKDIMQISTYILNSTQAYVNLYLDFEVEGGKALSVSTLAAYSDNYLHLSGGGGTPLYAGNTAPVQVYGAPFIVDRDWGENDVNEKIKGIDGNSSNEVKAELKYVIDDNTSGNLKVNIIDPFYGSNFKNKQSSWVSNINPIADEYFEARLRSSPSNLMSFQYYEGGGDWIFDFKYTVPNSPWISDSNYAVQSLEAGENNPKLSSTIINHFKNVALTQSYMPYPNGITQAKLNKTALRMGNYGVIYTHNIDINNVGNTTRNLKYKLRCKCLLGYKYEVRNYDTNALIASVSDTINSDAAAAIFDILNINLNGNTHYKITAQYLCSVGDAGFENQLVLN